MERRRSKRIRVNLKAECITVEVNHAVFIENLSKDGVYIQTAPSKTTIDFISGTLVELQFQVPSGETLSLNCEVRWEYKNPPDGLTSSIGMEIIDPPPRYKEFVKTLL